MQKIVPIEEMYRRRREGRGVSSLAWYSGAGVPPIVGEPTDFREDIQKRVSSLPLFGSFDLYAGSARELIVELERRDVQIEKEARGELMVESIFSIALGHKTGHKTGHRFAVDLVEVDAAILGLEENSPYVEIFTAAMFYGLMPCVNYAAPSVVLSYAMNEKAPKDPYVVFAKEPLSQSILFTLEVKSRTWGGVTLGAVNGALDFVAPLRKYIFAKKYTRIP